MNLSVIAGVDQGIDIELTTVLYIYDQGISLKCGTVWSGFPPGALPMTSDTTQPISGHLYWLNWKPHMGYTKLYPWYW